MTQKIPCFCDNSFAVEVPSEIDLDSSPGYINEILDGSFLNFTCPGCGKKHKPEFPIKILWPSKKIWFDVCVETDRGEFYRQKKEAPKRGLLKKDPSDLTKETIIGYPELAERILVYRDSLEPMVIETIKYFLYLKAEENYTNEEIIVWYSGFAQGPAKSLEFHIHGIKEGEVAVMKVPFSLYEKNLEDFRKHPKAEIFASLRVRSYLSVKNMMRPRGLK